jgi:hypothetical protein
MVQLNWRQRLAVVVTVLYEIAAYLMSYKTGYRYWEKNWDIDQFLLLNLIPFVSWGLYWVSLAKRENDSSAKTNN